MTPVYEVSIRNNRWIHIRSLQRSKLRGIHYLLIQLPDIRSVLIGLSKKVSEIEKEKRKRE